MRQDDSLRGRYEITGELGRGSTGVVHRARDPETNRDLAIKTFLWPNDIPDERRKEYQDSLYRQANAAGRLSHPAIVTVYEIDEDEEDGLPFVAMEFVPGPTLHELIRKEGALNPDWAITVAETLAGALQAASALDVIHPDFKPANILVRESDGVAKITDFAMAHLVDSTDPSEVRGTPAYMAPECIEGESADLRSQLYSLAAIFHEMLCGEPPFVGETTESVRHAIVNEPPVPITERADDLAGSFDTFFDRALAKDPADRFTDVASFAHALELLRRDQRQFAAEARTVPDDTSDSVWDLDIPEMPEPQPLPTEDNDLPVAVPLPEMTGSRVRRDEQVVKSSWLDAEHNPLAGHVWKVAAILVTILLLVGVGWIWSRLGPAEPPLAESEPGASSNVEPATEPTSSFLDWNPTPYAAVDSEFSAWDDLVEVRPARNATKTVKTKPAPAPVKTKKPVVAPAIAEAVPEPEPEIAVTPAETEPVAETLIVPAFAVDISYVDVFLKSGVKDGNLTLLVDGREVYSAGLSTDSKKMKRLYRKAVGKAHEKLETRIEIPAGGATITARMFNTAKSKQYEKTLEVDLGPGEERVLRIVAGRTLGRSLTMKLD